MAIEFSERVRRIPVYPAARRLRAGRAVARLACNESPDPPLPAVVEAVERALRRAQPLSGPDNALLRAALSRPLRGAGVADRDRQRLVRHPARGRRGAARARRRARLRVAVVLASTRISRRPRARARSTVPLDADAAPRPRRDAARDHRRHAARARVQPEQPDQDGDPARRRSPASSREVPRHVCVLVDEAYCEFNLLEDPDASLRAARRTPQPRAAADVLARSTGCAGCASASRCAARTSCRGRSTRSASRSSATRSPRPPRRGARPPGRRDRPRRRARSPSASRVRGAAATRSASSPPTRRPTSAGSTLGAGRDEGEIVDGLAERGVLVRGGARARQRDGGAARDLRHAGGERPLPRRARRAALSGAAVYGTASAVTSFETAAAVLGGLLLVGALLSGMAQRSCCRSPLCSCVAGFVLGEGGTGCWTSTADSGLRHATSRRRADRDPVPRRPRGGRRAAAEPLAACRCASS